VARTVALANLPLATRKLVLEGHAFVNVNLSGECAAIGDFFANGTDKQEKAIVIEIAHVA
jgi:hypothetical protein